MKKSLLLITVALLMFGLAGTSSALMIENLGFETGDFTGWHTRHTNLKTTGFTLPESRTTLDMVKNIDVVPRITRGRKTGSYVYHPVGGKYFAGLENESYIHQSINWSANDVLSFDWGFYSEKMLNEIAPEKLTIFRILNEKGEIIKIVTLADLIDLADINLDEAADSFNTGWQQYAYTFTDDGSGTIIFGFDFDDWASKLYIDISGVPEPGTLLLMGLGLLGLIGMYRKRRMN
jgi:hypothetical protein